MKHIATILLCLLICIPCLSQSRGSYTKKRTTYKTTTKKRTNGQRTSSQTTAKISVNGNKLIVNGLSYEMIKVEAGTIPVGEEQLSVTKDFYIGKTEVTQALWKAVMGNNTSYFKGNNKPVEQVSWNDCQKFLQKLNAATGKNFRLPTEVEWEFAARGGNKTSCYQYSGGNNCNDVAWNESNSGAATCDVATKLPNELGLYDMSGNVYEWCSDNKYNIPLNEPMPLNRESARYAVIRGGSWYEGAKDCTSSSRLSIRCGTRCSIVGVRLVLSE